MIFDSIKNIKNYKEMGVIFDTLQYLANLSPDAESFESVRYGTVSCFRDRYRTVPEAGKDFEAHKKYIDIHYTLKGVEGIAFADVKELREKGAFSEEKDIGFYEGFSDGLCYVREGMFMVCFPEDAHKPGIMNGVPGMVEKIIAKIGTEEA